MSGKRICEFCGLETDAYRCEICGRRTTLIHHNGYKDETRNDKNSSISEHSFSSSKAQSQTIDRVIKQNKNQQNGGYKQTRVSIDNDFTGKKKLPLIIKLIITFVVCSWVIPAVLGIVLTFFSGIEEEFFAPNSLEEVEVDSHNDYIEYYYHEMELLEDIGVVKVMEQDGNTVVSVYNNSDYAISGNLWINEESIQYIELLEPGATIHFLNDTEHVEASFELVQCFEIDEACYEMPLPIHKHMNADNMEIEMHLSEDFSIESFSSIANQIYVQACVGNYLDQNILVYQMENGSSQEQLTYRIRCDSMTKEVALMSVHGDQIYIFEVSI